MRVKATREGLVGQTTASGYVIDTIVPFVALPSTRAVHRLVRLNNPATQKTTYAVVLDVGPWNEHDDAYVFGGSRPQAETGTTHAVGGQTAPESTWENGSGKSWAWLTIQMWNGSSCCYEHREGPEHQTPSAVLCEFLFL